MKHYDIIPGSIIQPLPDDSYIQHVEQNLRVKFPEDYKEFLKHYGGCEIEGYGPFLADGHQWAIDRFLCLLKNSLDHPLGEYDIEATWSMIDGRLGEDPDALGAEMVPITVLFAGDMVCLDYRHTKTNPPVVIWLHEQSEYLSPVTRPVANSFTEFLDLIH